MTGLGWLLYLLCMLGALAVSAWIYRRREAPGQGRPILIALRFIALALVLLLLFDPRLPARRAGAGHGQVVLLDNSLSMSLPADPGAPRGPTRWARAVAEARRLAGSRGPILAFGADARPTPGGA